MQKSEDERVRDLLLGEMPRAWVFVAMLAHRTEPREDVVDVAVEAGVVRRADIAHARTLCFAAATVRTDGVALSATRRFAERDAATQTRPRAGRADQRAAFGAPGQLTVGAAQPLLAHRALLRAEVADERVVRVDVRVATRTPVEGARVAALERDPGVARVADAAVARASAPGGHLLARTPHALDRARLCIFFFYFFCFFSGGGRGACNFRVRGRGLHFHVFLRAVVVSARRPSGSTVAPRPSLCWRGRSSSSSRAVHSFVLLRFFFFLLFFLLFFGHRRHRARRCSFALYHALAGCGFHRGCNFCFLQRRCRFFVEIARLQLRGTWWRFWCLHAKARASIVFLHRRCACTHALLSASVFFWVWRAWIFFAGCAKNGRGVGFVPYRRRRWPVQTCRSF